MVGVVFRNFEWETDTGATGWSTECGTFVSVDDIKNGKFKPMKDRPLKKKSTESTPAATDFTPVDDSDLPF
jgi:hypothetical protein